jgi:hypothetical protein
LNELGKFIAFVCRVAFFAPLYNIASQGDALAVLARICTGELVFFGP